MQSKYSKQLDLIHFSQCKKTTPVWSDQGDIPSFQNDNARQSAQNRMPSTNEIFGTNYFFTVRYVYCYYTACHHTKISTRILHSHSAV